MKKILIITFALAFSLSLASCSNINDNKANVTDTINKEIIKLSDAYEFLNNSSDSYIRVRREEGAIGVAPGSLNYVSYSDDKEIIQKALDNLNVKIAKASFDLPTGGQFTSYRFYKLDGSYDEIYISNDLIHYNGTYYELDNNYNTIIPGSKDQIYSLYLYDSHFKVYKNNEAVGEFNRTHELEFIKTDEITREPICRLKNDFLELFIYSKNEFSVLVEYDNNSYHYYKVVGDVDFSSIIE